MATPTCEKCGSSEFVMIDGKKHCAYCRSLYIGAIQAPQSTISLNDDVERLLAQCRLDPAKAPKLANLILELDPFNQEALRYL